MVRNECLTPAFSFPAVRYWLIDLRQPARTSRCVFDRSSQDSDLSQHLNVLN